MTLLLTQRSAVPSHRPQLGYPRSPTIRKYWILRQVMKLVVFLGLILFIIEQVSRPTTPSVEISWRSSRGHLKEKMMGYEKDDVKHRTSIFASIHPRKRCHV